MILCVFKSMKTRFKKSKKIHTMLIGIITPEGARQDSAQFLLAGMSPGIAQVRPGGFPGSIPRCPWEAPISPLIFIEIFEAP